TCGRAAAAARSADPALSGALAALPRVVGSQGVCHLAHRPVRLALGPLHARGGARGDAGGLRAAVVPHLCPGRRAQFRDPRFALRRPARRLARMTGLDASLAAALRTTRLPLAQARTLPAACYTDPAIHALERRELFGRHWLAVARDEDLPEAGSFVTRGLGGDSILIVRGSDARLRAFFNVCRHRGSRLVAEPCGQLRGAIACPYHAWTYELDGRLRQAPRMGTGAQ